MFGCTMLMITFGVGFAIAAAVARQRGPSAPALPESGVAAAPAAPPLPPAPSIKQRVAGAIISLALDQAGKAVFGTQAPQGRRRH